MEAAAESRSSQTAARLFLLGAIIIWGWTFVATKICLNYLTGMQLIGMRYIIGLPAIYLIMRAIKQPIRFPEKGRGAVIAASLILAVHLLIQIVGLKLTTATNTGWIIGVTPLTLAVLSALILREKISKQMILGIVVASVGILLLISKGDFSSIVWLENLGDWIILGSTFSWTLYTIVIRDVARAQHPILVTFQVLIPATVFLSLYLLIENDWSAVIHLPADGMIALLFLGVLGIAVAHWFWQAGVARLGAAQSGMFLYLEPLATTMLAVPYLHEPFTWATAVGGLLVLAGVYVSQSSRGKKVQGV